MASTIQIRRGLETNLPVLSSGELGFTTDTFKIYIGDGTINHLVGGGGTANDATITLTAGSGITGGGTFTTDQAANGTITLNHEDTSSQVTVNNSNGTVIQDISVDTYGHVTVLGSIDLDARYSSGSVNDATITLSAGSGITGGGDFTANQIANETITFNHEDTSNQTSVNNTGSNVIQDISVDTYGHVTVLGSIDLDSLYSDPNDATITLAAGSGITGGGNFTVDQATNETITFNHEDTSSQASVNNSNGIVIQDISVDTYGHVTVLGSIDLDSRYYTGSVNDATITLTAGSGITGGGNFTVNQLANETITFNHEDTSSQVTVNNTGSNVIQDISVDTYGHVTLLGSIDLDSLYSDPNDATITLAAGSGITGGGDFTANQIANETITFNHEDTSNQASVNNSNGTVIQDISVDIYGHVTVLGSIDLDARYSSGSVNDATITLAAGSGITGGGDFTANQIANETITFNHEDTSSQVTVNNSNGNVIQDISVDTYGHVTVLGSIDLDSRYYTGSVNDATITMAAGSGITGGGNFTVNQLANETITFNHEDTSTQTSVNNSNGTVIQDISVDTYGHVTVLGSINLDSLYSDPNDATITLTAGSGITGGGDFTVNQLANETITFNHEDTSSQVTVNNSNGVVIQDISVDTYGHVTVLGSIDLDSRYYTGSVNDATITMAAGSGITGGGNFTVNQATNETITFNHEDTSSQVTVNNSNGNVIQDISVDTYGHVTLLGSIDLDSLYSDPNDATITLTAGSGITGGGIFTTDQAANGTITFNHEDTSTQTSVNNSNGIVIQDISVDTYGHVTSLGSIDLDSRYYTGSVNDATITLAAGSGITGGGDFTANQLANETITFNHEDTSTQASVNNSNGNVIQDISVDTYGHVTVLGSIDLDSLYSDPNDATITLTAGSGITGGGTFTTDQAANGTITFNHEDTSTQASVNNSNGNVIQDISVDTYGHVTVLGSIDLDSRYYTETESDSRYVNITGDTMTGDLTIQADLYIGNDGGGDSRLLFYDDTNNTSRELFWDDSASDWRIEDNTGVMRVLWHSGNDGSGTGLDADLLDNVQGSSYLRSDATDTYSGGVLIVRSETGIDITNTSQIQGLQINQTTSNADALMTFHVSGDYALHFGLDGDTNDLAVGGWSMGANKYKIHHDGNTPPSKIWTTKTANYTSSNGDKLFCNTSGGVFTITLPTSPSVGDTIIVADPVATGSWNTNNLTVARNGEDIRGIAENMICDVDNCTITFVYYNATDGWHFY